MIDDCECEPGKGGHGLCYGLTRLGFVLHSAMLLLGVF
jgi:hypothetical protein